MPIVQPLQAAVGGLLYDANGDTQAIYVVGSMFVVLVMAEEEPHPGIPAVVVDDVDVEKHATGTPMADIPPGASVDVVIPTPRERAITVRLRDALTHVMTVRGGGAGRIPWPLLRGIGYYMLWQVAYTFAGVAMDKTLDNDDVVGAVVCRVLQDVVASPLYIAWVHSVTSASNKGFLARMPSWRTVRACVPAIAVSAMVAGLMLLVFESDGDETISGLFADVSGNDILGDVVGSLYLASSFGLSMLATYLITLPMLAVRTRIVVSTLPVDEQVIVPFDWSFGGAHLDDDNDTDESGRVVCLRDAWRAFGASDRRRVALAVLKALGCCVCMVVAEAVLAVVLRQAMLERAFTSATGVAFHFSARVNGGYMF